MATTDVGMCIHHWCTATIKHLASFFVSAHPPFGCCLQQLPLYCLRSCGLPPSGLPLNPKPPKQIPQKEKTADISGGRLSTKILLRSKGLQSIATPGRGGAFDSGYKNPRPLSSGCKGWAQQKHGRTPETAKTYF